MGYLRFEKVLMTNLEESLSRELLRTNRSGAYACSTIVNCNTSRYHGLLVVPVPELDDDNHVLLSAMDVTVVQHGAEFNLGLHKYQGNNFSPTGHKYIREFSCDKIPTTIYRVGGVLLKREVVFQHFENRLLIRYTLLDAHSDTILRFRPYLAFRSVRQLTHENSVVNKSYTEVEDGIKTCMYAGYPDLYLQFSKRNKFEFHPDWYRNMVYPKDSDNGIEGTEDLYVPGYFEMNICKGEELIFAASTSEMKSGSLKRLFQKETEERAPRDNFFHCLVNAAHQFHNYTNRSERYIPAGYPWLKCRARDMFIALPGLTLSIDEQDKFEAVMKTAERGIMEFVQNKPLSVKISDIDKPDVLLWAAWTIQQYAKSEGIDNCNEKYWKLVRDIISFISGGNHPNIRLDENGLIYSDGTEKPITWMDSVANDKPIVPRSGYIVEFNALWYNALRFGAELAAMNENSTNFVSEWSALAERCKTSFSEIFFNECGYLFDYVDGDNKDWSVRPNMIFPVAFDYSPLSPEQKKSILDVCTRELLTPKGLRSLSPKSCGYNPMYVGAQRSYAYHQGTAWPWLCGFYMEACLKLYKRTRLSFIERQMVGYEDEMTVNCLGTIPELFDGNPPFHARGAISFAMNVAETLRALTLLEKYNYVK